jgi:hypothetical protein
MADCVLLLRGELCRIASFLRNIEYRVIPETVLSLFLVTDSVDIG